MGLLDQVIGGLMGGGQQQGQNPMLQAVLGSLLSGSGGAQGGMGAILGSLLGGGGQQQATAGGLGGLLSQFQQAGLGHLAESWVGSGPNQPVSPDQLSQVLGPDRINSMATQAGMAPHDMLSQLSHLLPAAVDKLTPGGATPEASPFDGAGQNL